MKKSPPFQPDSSSSLPHLSVVIPVFKSERCLDELYLRLKAALETISKNFEIVLVEDCSGDNSWQVIERLAAADSRVCGIQFSRNFGQHYAITAGLDHCHGDWVVVMDCDLQDRPEEIPRLYAKAQEGYDVVLAWRGARHHTLFKRLTSWLFYKLFSYFTDIDYDGKSSNFRIVSRKVVTNFCFIRERLRFLGGLVHWMGFPTASIEVTDSERFQGKSTYTFSKLWKLALESIIAYSDKPLRLAVRFGFLMAFLAFCYGLFILVRAMMYDVPILGWSSLIVSLYFLGGIIIAILGIIGVYLGKTFDETKKRPLYIIQKTTFTEIEKETRLINFGFPIRYALNGKSTDSRINNGYMPNKKKLNVLVLGVGGNVSQGILKALCKSDLHCRIIGACVTPYAMGLYTADVAYVSPYANAPSFVDWLYDLCRKEKIDAVLTGVEEVLTVLAEHKENLRKQTGALCIVSAPSQLLIGRDKLLTCQWLKQNAFNYPEFADAADTIAVNKLVDSVGYPLVVKPRKGKSSEEIVIVQNAEGLERVKVRQGYVVEQCLGTEDDEYTVGCFCDKEGVVRGSIVMRRRLYCGTTSWAEIDNCDLVREEAQRIVSELKPMGPCNVQLRVSNGKATSFELNVRFSGTTPLRAHYGFNDVDIALRHYVLDEPAKNLPIITAGVALRYWNEIYVDPQAFHEAVQKGRLDPTAYHTSIENYGEQ